MAQLVEHNLAKVGVAGSSPVVRSIAFPDRLGGPFSAKWPSGKAEACKAFMPQFKSGWCLQCPKGVSLWDFHFYLFLYLLSRHTCAGIFCFYLESGEVLRKKMDSRVLVSPR